MSDILTSTSADYRSIGIVLAVVTVAICIIYSVVFRRNNPESDYLFGVEFEATPRLVFMLFLSVWAGGLMIIAWTVFAPLAFIGLVILLTRTLNDRRIIRHARRSRST